MESRVRPSWVLLLALTALLTGCALHVERPRVALVGVALEDVGLLESSLAITLRVENPNGFRLTIERGVYRVSLGGTAIGDGAIGAPLDIPAHAARRERIVVRLDNLRLLARFHELLAGRVLAYRIEADHRLGGLGARRELRSVAEGELDLGAAPHP